MQEEFYSFYQLLHQYLVDKALIVKPRIILTDITAPRSEWHQMISSLKENLPDTRLIVLTNSEKDEDVLDALSSGVDGYFLKGSSAVFTEMRCWRVGIQPCYC